MGCTGCGTGSENCGYCEAFSRKVQPLVRQELKQDVFNGKDPRIVVAAVDYDGLLKYGDSTAIRYTWASERWRGAEWLEKVEKTDFEPLTKIDRA